MTSAFLSSNKVLDMAEMLAIQAQLAADGDSTDLAAQLAQRADLFFSIAPGARCWG